MSDEVSDNPRRMGRERLPLVLYALVLILTGAVFLVLGWHVYESYKLAKVTVDRELRLKELRGSLLHLEEVLTMSARMAAVTGDLSWEKRYRHFEPILDAEIKETIRLAPGSYSGKAAIQTNVANLRLVEMEHQSFDHVRQSRLKEAQGILFGEEYGLQKRIYAEGMKKFDDQIEARSRLLLNSQRNRIFLSAGLAIISIPLLFFAWLAVYRTLHRWRRVLEDSYRQLLLRSQQLAELNQTLDKKVTERTQELRQAYERLRQTQRELIQYEKLAALGRFSSGLAHEVKNPLGIILGGVEFLEHKVSTNGDADVQMALTKMKDSVKRADAIIQTLLQFSRPSEMKVERVTPEVVVNETLSLLKYRTPLKDIALETLFSGQEKLWIEVDKNQIQQVLFNLLMNAVEAMPQGGKITIQTSKSKSQWCVMEVTDTGGGISIENLSRLFEPFFTTKRDRKGTGLGLSVSQKIVQSHGGDLIIESQLGQGTKVKILLPLAGKV